MHSGTGGNSGLVDYDGSITSLGGLIYRSPSKNNMPTAGPIFNLKQCEYLVGFILDRSFMSCGVVTHNVYSAARLCIFFKRTLFNMESNLAQLRTVTFKPTFCDFFFFSVL